MSDCDYVRYEWLVSTKNNCEILRQKLAIVARALVPGDRIIVELLGVQVKRRWRLRGSDFDTSALHRKALSAINLAKDTEVDVVLVVEWVGSTEEHWLHWLPSLHSSELRKSHIELQMAQARAKLTANQRTVLDCAARTLTDAILRIDERQFVRMRASESDDEREKASFHVLFQQPVPLGTMPLLIAMSPLRRAGKLPGVPHIFYATTPLKCVLEITSYGVGDAMPVRVNEDMFFGLEDGDGALDAPFDIDNGKRPFKSICDRTISF